MLHAACVLQNYTSAIERKKKLKLYNYWLRQELLHRMVASYLLDREMKKMEF